MKLLVEEPGSDDVAAVWDAADRRVSSRLAYPEARAALAAARRAGRIGRTGADAARRDLERLWNGLAVVDLTAALARRAGDLAEEHSLRGFDAVHLASAESVSAEGVAVVTSDVDLRRAAETLGLVTARLAG